MNFDFYLLAKIYEITKIKNELLYYSKLLNEFANDKQKLNQTIDKMFDLNMIKGKWGKFGDKWCYSINISDSILPFAKECYLRVCSNNKDNESEK